MSVKIVIVSDNGDKNVIKNVHSRIDITESESNQHSIKTMTKVSNNCDSNWILIISIKHI